MTVYGADIDII